MFYNKDTYPVLKLPHMVTLWFYAYGSIIHVHQLFKSLGKLNHVSEIFIGMENKKNRKWIN